MQLDKFTLKAQEALSEARQLAESRNHAQLETEHLLGALMDQEGGLTMPILERIGANHAALRQELEAKMNSLSRVTGSSQVSASNRVGKVLDSAQKEASKMKDSYTSTEHVLLALAQDGGWTSNLLKQHGITLSLIHI